MENKNERNKRNIDGNLKHKDLNFSNISRTDKTFSLPAFSAEYNDQFETPLQAYEDLYLLLEYYRRQSNKDKSQFIIYDPYFCQGVKANFNINYLLIHNKLLGNMKRHLAILGYTNVLNNNRDFYRDIETNSLPGNLFYF